jgi:TolB-like protein
VKKLAFFLISVFFLVIPVTGAKYVAVVETDVDASSGASTELTSAEVREITAELRRQATENLPRSQYNVMTSETVMSMGGAVLEECAEENCVIALGSKIGADYIVRGTISKFQTKFTLTIELYETDNGTLIVSSDAVRSENLEDLLEKATVACSNMYKKFVESQRAMQKPQAAADTVLRQPEKKAKPKKEKPAPKPKPEPKPKPPKPAPKPIEWPPMKLSAGSGLFFTDGFGGGIKWTSDEAVAMPYSGGGIYIFLDATYAEVFAGYTMTSGTWESSAATNEIIPDMKCSYLNIGVLAKYPFTVGNIKLFPLLGIDYEAAVSGKLEFTTLGQEYEFDGMDDRYAAKVLTNFWVKFGGGVEFNITESLYLRGELLYGVRTANDFEKNGAIFNSNDGTPMTGQGVSLRAGVGFNF